MSCVSIGVTSSRTHSVLLFVMSFGLLPVLWLVCDGLAVSTHALLTEVRRFAPFFTAYKNLQRARKFCSFADDNQKLLFSFFFRTASFSTEQTPLFTFHVEYPMYLSGSWDRCIIFSWFLFKLSFKKGF